MPETAEAAAESSPKERREYVSEFSEFDDILATLDAKNGQNQIDQDEAFKDLIDEMENTDSTEAEPVEEAPADKGYQKIEEEGDEE